MVMSILGSNLFVSRPTTAIDTAVAIAPGSNAMPVCSARHAQVALQKHRQRERHRVQADAHHDAEQRADPHLPMPHDPEVDHRMVSRQLAPQQRGAANERRSTVSQMISRESNQSSRWPCSSTYCSAPTLTREQRDALVVDRRRLPLMLGVVHVRRRS